MNKKLVLIVSIIILIALIVGGGIYYWQKSSFEKEVEQAVENIKNDLEKKIQTLEVQIEQLKKFCDWNLYENPEFPFTIKYPKSWLFREFSLGVAFRPPKESEEKKDIILQEAINVQLHGGGCASDIDYETCVRIAGAQYPPELIDKGGGNLGWEGYLHINSLEKIITQTGDRGYKTTWAVVPFLAPLGEEVISHPITFLQYRDKGSSAGHILIVLENLEYIDIYDRMIKTFDIIK